MSPVPPERQRPLLAAGLQALGKRRLLLSIHDASFPSDPDEDIGWGSPYTRGGRGFLRFAAGLGFTGVLFGPQGLTSRINPSPYDGTIFSRSVLSIALRPLAGPEWGLLDRRVIDELVMGRPAGGSGRARYVYAFDAQRRALREALRGLGARPEFAARLRAFVDENRGWLAPDARYEALVEDPGVPAETIALYELGQFVAHAQHRELQRLAAGLSLRLYGDLQIGLSVRDRAHHGGLFLAGYLMGAPPSRTNPAGQPWAYPVFDPGQYQGPVLDLVRARIGKLLGEFDGLRIDHPHGLICPWVYRADDPDPLHAVRHGARLFSSPDLPDHPELAPLAIARPEQIDRGVTRYDDGWVRDLTPEQVQRYAMLFDAVVAGLQAAGRATADLLCEVLSTYPYPIRRVIERHGLGRFRVTQKADFRDPGDVYRSENAAPADWVMVGNHDTPPIWRVAERWQAEGQLRDRAAYLAARLCPDPGRRDALAARLASDPAALVQAQFADLFVCPAENVLVFFADLLGLREIYNVPGVVNEDNWSLRVPPDYAQDYRRKLAAGAALNLPAVLALALRARGAGGEILAGLDELAAAWRGP
jgi:4-alpha-glucanotransferase